MSDAPDTPTKGVGKGLKKKVGPLPMWAWYSLVGLGLGGVILYLRRDGTSSTANATAENPNTLNGGINEDAYGSGYMSGAGSYDTGLTDAATGGTDITPYLDNMTAQQEQFLNGLDSSLGSFFQGADTTFLSGGGASDEPKASPTNSTAAKTNVAAATTAKKKAVAKTYTNTGTNARKGQTYKVERNAAGNDVHVYASGKRVEIKPAKKSTVTTAPKPKATVIAAAQVNNTGNARSGQTYKTVRNADGSEYHLYENGRKVQTKKATAKPAAKKKK